MRTPLNPGRRRPIEHCRSRPTAHVSAEADVSRACPSTGKNRYDQYGEARLRARSGVPHSPPAQTPPDIVERTERRRRDNKWPARRNALQLANQGPRISERTVARWRPRPGIDHRRLPDPDASANRRPPKRWPATPAACSTWTPRKPGLAAAAKTSLGFGGHNAAPVLTRA
ncbi:hypothetical protein [Streptomyces sp. URMC 129]|uniref:hypothetical protein n=1 Tax=Streptomyces sp. URMC 129 TaxID=3423407 RepID=UPI003F1CAB69